MISPPAYKEGEITKVRACFDMGLNCFHLRKPGWSAEDYKAYLANFSVSDQKKIHVHKLLDDKQTLGGIHLSESTWRKLSISDFKKLRKEADYYKQSLSVSLHGLKDVENAVFYSDYAFLSPVYDSISKINYKAAASVWDDIKHRKPADIKIIALGGVRIEHYSDLQLAGFDGVAVLGAFWELNVQKGSLDLFWKKATQLFSI